MARSSAIIELDRRIRWIAVVLASIMLLAGCGGAAHLMPTPNVYAQDTSNPFENVPPEFQNNHVDVLYLTDRLLQSNGKLELNYGYERSRSVAFGNARVEIGNNVSWADIVKASTTSSRSGQLDLTVSQVTELGRFPPTPRSLVQLEAPTTLPTTDLVLPGDTPDAPELAAEAAFHRELSARLAKTPVKEVYLFVHGYHNTFDDSVETIAQIWHFLGRQGVPIAYSWPAGGKGLIRGYTYDTESSEFTVFHLEQMLRVIAECPDVKKVNIIAHSRGTDTTISALRELCMGIEASGKNPRQILKLGTLVLAAPDIDVDVVIQKVATIRLGMVPERVALYINTTDKALGLSSWLFGGILRLGEIKANLFSPAELKFLRDSKTMQIIDAQVTNPGDFGHNYFYANPAVSSDLVLLMRYHLYPGVKYGRPLGITPGGFWSIEDKYPAPCEALTEALAGK
jgi:esterase/lipase superfamily enzyme